MARIKYILTAVLAALVALFAFQNMAEVDLTFLVWTFHSRRIVVIVLSVAIGVVIGWLLGRGRVRER